MRVCVCVYVRSFGKRFLLFGFSSYCYYFPRQIHIYKYINRYGSVYYARIRNRTIEKYPLCAGFGLQSLGARTGLAEAWCDAVSSCRLFELVVYSYIMHCC